MYSETLMETLQRKNSLQWKRVHSSVFLCPNLIKVAVDVNTAVAWRKKTLCRCLPKFPFTDTSYWEAELCFPQWSNQNPNSLWCVGQQAAAPHICVICDITKTVYIRVTINPQTHCSVAWSKTLVHDFAPVPEWVVSGQPTLSYQ